MSAARPKLDPLCRLLYICILLNFRIPKLPNCQIYQVTNVLFTRYLGQPEHSQNFWNIVRICGWNNRNSGLCYSRILMIFRSFDYLFEGLFKTVVRICGQHTHNSWLVYTHIMIVVWSAPAKTHFICSRTILNLKSDY